MVGLSLLLFSLAEASCFARPWSRTALDHAVVGKRTSSRALRLLALGLAMVWMPCLSSSARGAKTAAKADARPGQWAVASSSPVMDTSALAALNLATISLAPSERRDLAPGKWTLLRLGAFEAIRIRTLDPKSSAELRVRRVIGASVVQGLVEASPPSRENGQWNLVNVQLQPQLFLVSLSKPASLRFEKSLAMTPDRVWTQANENLWAAWDKRMPLPSQEVLKNPEITHLFSTARGLRATFPHDAALIDAWHGWALSRALLRLRPDTLVGWEKREVLTTQHDGLHWTPPPRGLTAKTYERVKGPALFQLPVKGPGVLELEARRVFDPAQPSDTKISVLKRGRILADTIAPSKAALRPCKVHPTGGTSVLRCDVEVDAQRLMGRATRLRIPIHEKSEALSLKIGEGETLLHLRNLRLRPSLRAAPLRSQARGACKKARRLLARASKSASSVMRSLLSGCVEPSGAVVRGAGSSWMKLCRNSHAAAACVQVTSALATQAKSDERTRLLTAACTALRRQEKDRGDLQHARGRLALQLLDADALEEAQACVSGQAKTFDDEGFLRVRGQFDADEAQFLLRRRYRACTSAKGASDAWCKGLYEQWAAQSGWRRASGLGSSSKAKSWLLMPEQAVSAKGAALGVTRSWSALLPNQDYQIRVPGAPDTPKKLTRVDLVWGGHVSAPRVVVDDQPQLLSLSGSRVSFLLSPGEHRVRVEGQAGLRVAATLGRSENAGQSQALRTWLWRLPVKGEPLGFELPPKAAQVPVRVLIRRKGPAASAPQPFYRIWLHDDQGSRRELRVYASQLALQPSTPLSGFGELSSALSFQLKLPDKVSRIWFEAEAEAEDLFLVSVQFREASVLKPSVSAQPEKKKLSLSTDPELAHARVLLDEKRWTELRGLFRRWAKSPSNEDLALERERLAVFRAYQLHLEARMGQYDALTSAESAAVIALPFLNEREEFSLDDARSQLKRALEAFDAEHPAEAANAAYRFSEAKPPSNSSLWPVTFGLTHRFPYLIDNPRLNALRGRAARHSRWHTLKFASASYGHEHTQRIPMNPTLPVGKERAPFAAESGFFLLHPSQTRSIEFELATSGELRLKSYCWSEGNFDEPLAFSLDDASTQRIQAETNRMKTMSWALSGGSHQLTMATPSGLRCAFMLQTRDQSSSPWATLLVPLKQRWFAAGPSRPFLLHVQGPTTLALITRSLGQGDSAPIQLRVNTSKGNRMKFLPVSLNVSEDRGMRLSRDPTIRVNEAQETLVVLPQNEVYSVELSSETREVLVRARKRVTKEVALPQEENEAWSGVLESRSKPVKTAEGPPDGEPSFSDPRHRRFRGTQAPPVPSRSSWELALRTGVDQETQYERIRARYTSGIRGSWRREWVAGRLWVLGRLGGQSQSWSLPMYEGLVQVGAQARKIPVRARVGAHLGVQPLAGQIPSAQRGWLEVETSLRDTYHKFESWDLRPSLRLNARFVGSKARTMAEGSIGKYLHSLIYRRYSDQHPWALLPKLVWSWRDLRDARVEVGADAWLNADFSSLDRTRAWMNLSAIKTQLSNRPSWWTFDFSYRWTYAFKDRHRSRTFMRHELSARLRWEWQWKQRRRLQVGLADRLLFSSGRFAGNELNLVVGLRFDPFEAMRHRAPWERRFASEFGRGDWRLR